jgi:hypothetical protein
VLPEFDQKKVKCNVYDMFKILKSFSMCGICALMPRHGSNILPVTSTLLILETGMQLRRRDIILSCCQENNDVDDRAGFVVEIANYLIE